MAAAVVGTPLLGTEALACAGGTATAVGDAGGGDTAGGDTSGGDMGGGDTGAVAGREAGATEAAVLLLGGRDRAIA